MSLDLNRWLQYAKAKLDATVRAGNDELDQLEAEQAAKAEGKPWLSSEGDAPTLEEAQARIRWEADEAARAHHDAATKADAPGANDAGTAAPAAPVAPAADEGAAGATVPGAAPATVPAPDPTDPLAPADAAEAAAREQARVELEARQQAADARLAQIRAELGIDEPHPPTG